MWPQKILVKGISIQVNSWEDFDEVVQRYGQEKVSLEEELPLASKKGSNFTSSKLNDKEHVLLNQFVDGGTDGVLNNIIGPSLGATGKGINSALRNWVKRIDLVEGDTEAFEPFNSYKGRGYKLKDGYLPLARKILGSEK